MSKPIRKKFFFHLFFFALIISAFPSLAQQEVEVIKFDQLDKIIKEKGTVTKVINFWATWCGPCVKELPYFEEIDKKYNDDELEVTLINLDFSDRREMVEKFIKKKDISSRVLLLDEIDYNSWIDKVDPSWSGAIPATLIIDTKTGTRKFIEKELKEGELQQLIDKINN